MKAVIMAAGKSTRTYPLTLTRPKPLLTVANRTILEHQLRALTGIVDGAIVVVNYMRERIEAYFGADYEGLPIEYVVQSEPLGTGHAVLQCAEAVDGPFLAMNGDDLYDPGDLARLAQAEQAALVRQVADPRLYGIYEVVDGDRAVRLVEKPEQIFSTIANVGAYKFTPAVFEVLADTEKSPRGEIEITSAIQTLAGTSDFRVVEMEGYWLAIGYPWHLLDANEYLLTHGFEPEILGDVSPAADLNGRVSIGPGTVVRSGVVIDGPVCIGKDASIGPDCWIRPGTTVGNGCRVGHGVEIKNSILMDGCAVPHLSYVGDSVIGEGANLGAGTITANFRHDGANIPSMVKGKLVDSGRRKFGAIISDGVHTGINTAIYPGRKLWPDTFTYPNEAVTKDITEVKRRPPGK
ncbi:MAG: NTP transferase domain-containing protein [Candidatus Hydrogenedentes bacterium]|nr:NTP transferase domain-containing protein [Candidatus Hydrogenedentota bacterium]